MDAHRIVYQSEYWRLATSMVMCASLPEWMLLCLSWTLFIYNNPTFRPAASFHGWLGTFCASALVGQLWMLAWDSLGEQESQTATAAAWGTMGVLTSMGVDRPIHRDWIFAKCILWILLAWWELPCNSVHGMVGASFFAGLLAATATPPVGVVVVDKSGGCLPRPSWQVRLVLVLTAVLTPALCIAFQSPFREFD